MVRPLSHRPDSPVTSRRLWNCLALATVPFHHIVGQVHNPSTVQGHLSREYQEPDSSQDPVSFLKGLELLDSKSSCRERCCGTFVLFPIFQKTVPAPFKTREESLMGLGPGLLDPAKPGHRISRSYLLPHRDPEPVASSCLRFSSTQTAHNARGHTGPPSPWHKSVQRPCHREATVWSVLSWTCLPVGPSLDPSLLPALLLQMVPSRTRAPVVLCAGDSPSILSV